MKHAIRSLRKYITRYLVALLLLCFVVFVGGLTSCENRETGNRMRFLLDSLQQANRNYEEFTSDSLQLELCRYFDRWGTRNERMKAHYLLGRAYHDMGEIPHALECYQQATEMADTTSNDCDYKILRAIYGQMALLYEWQNLPDEEVKAYTEYSNCSWKIKDTLEAIRGYELTIGAAYMSNDTAKMLEITQHAHDLYMKYGYKNQAAGAYGVFIHILLVSGQYQKARPLMDIYEKEGGLFDKEGNIQKGREIYYYQQGLYQLGINNLDSAELLFRKSALSGQPEAPAKGLLMVYEKRGIADSIAKYAHLFAEANDEMHRNMRTETVEQITSMYNYNRYKEQAELAEQKSKRQRIIIISSIILFAFITTGIVVYTKKHKQRLLEQLAQENEQYISTLELLQKKEQQMSLLQTDSNKLLEKYRTDIDSLQSELRQYHDEDTAIVNYNNKLIDTLHSYARKLNGSPTKEEWEEFERFLSSTDSDFISFIGSMKYNLSSRDRMICMLIRKQFISSEISVLLNLTPSALSVRKRFINRKLFHRNSAEHLEKYISHYKRPC